MKNPNFSIKKPDVADQMCNYKNVPNYNNEKKSFCYPETVISLEGNFFFLKPLGASSIFARRRRTESRAGKSKGWRVAWARQSRDESAGELLGVPVMLLKKRLSAA